VDCGRERVSPHALVIRAQDPSRQIRIHLHYAQQSRTTFARSFANCCSIVEQIRKREHTRVNGQDFRWTVKKSKFLRREDPFPQTKKDETGCAFHSMVKSNSLKIVRMTFKYEIYKGPPIQSVSVASSCLGRRLRRFHDDCRNFMRVLK